MILKETYTLENGVQIPKLELGTWFIVMIRYQRQSNRATG